MGMAILCDGCGKDIQSEDRVSVQSMSIPKGTVTIDLCWDCAEPIFKVPAYQKEQERILEVIRLNQANLYPDPGPTIHNN